MTDVRLFRQTHARVLERFSLRRLFQAAPGAHGQAEGSLHPSGISKSIQETRTACSSWAKPRRVPSARANRASTALTAAAPAPNSGPAKNASAPVAAPTLSAVSSARGPGRSRSQKAIACKAVTRAVCQRLGTVTGGTAVGFIVSCGSGRVVPTALVVAVAVRAIEVRRVGIMVRRVVRIPRGRQRGRPTRQDVAQSFLNGGADAVAQGASQPLTKPQAKPLDGCEQRFERTTTPRRPDRPGVSNEFMLCTSRREVTDLRSFVNDLRLSWNCCQSRSQPLRSCVTRPGRYAKLGGRVLPAVPLRQELGQPAMAVRQCLQEGRPVHPENDLFGHRRERVVTQPLFQGIVQFLAVRPMVPSLK